MVAFESTMHAGVVLVRLRRARPAIVINRIGVAIAEAADAMEEVSVVLVEEARIRIRCARLGG